MPIHLYVGSPSMEHGSHLMEIPSSVDSLKKHSVENTLVYLQFQLASIVEHFPLKPPPAVPRSSAFAPDPDEQEKDEALNKCKTSFNSLPPEIRGAIYGQVWLLADKPPEEDRFGEKHAFDDLARLEKAIVLSGHFPVTHTVVILEKAITEPSQMDYARLLLKLFEESLVRKAYPYSAGGAPGEKVLDSSSARLFQEHLLRASQQILNGYKWNDADWDDTLDFTRESLSLAPDTDSVTIPHTPVSSSTFASHVEEKEESKAIKVENKAPGVPPSSTSISPDLQLMEKLGNILRGLEAIQCITNATERTEAVNHLFGQHTLSESVKTAIYTQTWEKHGGPRLEDRDPSFGSNNVGKDMGILREILRAEYNAIRAKLPPSELD
jgi:hypothetical protein